MLCFRDCRAEFSANLDSNALSPLGFIGPGVPGIPFVPWAPGGTIGRSIPGPMTAVSVLDREAATALTSKHSCVVAQLEHANHSAILADVSAKGANHESSSRSGKDFSFAGKRNMKRRR